MGRQQSDPHSHARVQIRLHGKKSMQFCAYRADDAIESPDHAFALHWHLRVYQVEHRSLPVPERKPEPFRLLPVWE